MAKKRSFFVVGIMALLFAACAPAGTPTPTATALSGATAVPTATPTPAPTAIPAKLRTIRMMTTAEPTALAPVISLGVLGEILYLNVLEPLVDVDRAGKPAPLLATKWEQRDATTWRLYLRKGVQFHNGASFTAADVVETVKWLIDEQKQSRVYGQLPFTAAVSVDDYTVDFSFPTPRPLFLIQQRELLISPVSQARDRRGEAETFPIGTGSYKFVSWERGLRIKLAKFEEYWGPKPQIDSVVITWRGEPAVRLAALRVGEVDWAQALVAEEARSAPKTLSIRMPDRYIFRPDVSVQKNPILADKRLRLAIDYAINREDLVRLFAGQATILQGQLAFPGEFGYDPNLKARPYDLGKATTLVQEARAVGKTITMVCTSHKRPKDTDVCDAAAAMIEKTGLKVKVTPLEQAEYTQYYRTVAPYREKMADLTAAAPDFIVESESRFGFTYYRGTTNLAFEDEEAWRLYDEVLAETDLDKRGEKLAKAWAYIYEQLYYIPLVVPTQAYGLAANLEWVPSIKAAPTVADMRFTD